MNRVKLGVLSLSEASPDGDDRPYLAWHQLDHMPEQYQIPGMVWAQRWAMSPAARRRPPAHGGRLAGVRNVVLYLVGDPVGQSLDDFFELGRRLSGLGRMRTLLPSPFLGGLHLLEALSGPGGPVSAEVAPFRPNRGVHLVLEEVTDPGGLAGHQRWVHHELLPALAAAPGVVGVWSFATTGHHRHPNFTPGRYGLTVCYLDEEPDVVGPALDQLWSSAWARPGATVTPLLAAPFASLVRPEWDRFGPGGRGPAG